VLPLAITGLGVVSPIGIGRVAFLEALRDPEAARRKAFSQPRSVLNAARFQGAQVAEVADFDAAQFLGDKGLRNFDRLTRMLIVAAKHALEDAGVKRDGAFTGFAPERVGICAATAYGALDSITEINRVAELEHPRFLNPSRFPNTVINSAAGYASIWEGLEGPNVTIVDGNCGAADAVLTAETHLAADRADVLLVGGAEVLSEPLYLAFERLGALAEQGVELRAGAGAREGLAGARLGEGAALCALEDAAAARRRGARVHAELVGYGTAFEAPAAEARLVHASARAVERALRAALRDAGLAPSEIDLVCCAEGGVGRIDAAERAGLARVFGPDQPRVASKAIWGETFGAASALSLAATLAWLEGTAPPGAAQRGGPAREIRHVLITAMGYYGNVSALIVRKGSLS
jgi:3-oxoacyl-[acyl-carrier-protein] synthase II